MAGLPPVFIEFLGKSTGVKTAMRDVKAELATADAAGAGAFQKTGMIGKAALVGLGLAAAGVAVHTVKMAGDFQVQMTRVRTGAGEAASNMRMVGQGVLAMAGEVGQSTSELTSGLYMVESAGYHGSDALKVLRASAMGAKVGAADLKTTTDAVTTAMNAYKTGAGSATEVTNALIATEAEGKTNLEALAGSMASILPVSAAAGVGLHEVLGAMATMTAQGTPAAVAATYLRQTIGQLSNPSGKAAREMESLGLSAVHVGQNLGKNGLASTLDMLTGAIEQHMGPAGTVLISHLQKAASNTTAFQKELANLSPAQQTYVGALATMVGGTKSMQAALQLTGPHMADFRKNTAGVTERVKAGGKEIEGWADVQKNFNQRLAEGKASAESLGIQIGQYLMPVVQAVVGAFALGVSWMARHSTTAKIAAAVIGGVLVFAIAALTASLYGMAAAAAVNPVTWIILGVVALIAAIVALALHWRQVWGAVKAVAADVGQAVAASWHWLAATTSTVWRSGIAGPVMAVWRAISGFFASAGRATVAVLLAAWFWLRDTTAAVWDSIAGFFRKWWPLLLVVFAFPIAVLVAAWNHWHEQVATTTHAVWDGLRAFFAASWRATLAVGSAVWSAIEAAVIRPTLATRLAVMSAWQALTRWLTDEWGRTRNAAAYLWGLIRSAVINPVLSAYRTVASATSSMAAAVRNALTQASNAARSIAGRFASVGSAIVHGIVNGVESAGGELFSSLRNLASGALSAAKNFLGINSPSRKFAVEVGQWIPHGVAAGIAQHTGTAVDAVTSMSGVLTRQRIGVPALTTGPTAFGPGPAAGAVHHHVHVTVQGSVLSERDLRDVVQSQMLRLGGRNSATWQSYKR
ncbi:phage tail tape measure protein [Streptomyces olivoreticuli]|uniref:phage tail tape measure protein n=1 Tax=Streptomyces olivoreticuli TaxID=68246 RepID=UPI00265B66C9|nr:phage tail tape measure protein [Streptomyces olivoreticuli]WKK26573.1 phage tail tape measure protein [Streptomyces olivoreticuli]